MLTTFDVSRYRAHASRPFAAIAKRKRVSAQHELTVGFAVFLLPPQPPLLFQEGVGRQAASLQQMKKRIDKLLVERGLAETREKAQAMIMAGNVLVDDQPATKAGMPVAEDASVRLKESPHPYVSRGGLKLEGAIRAFGLDVQGKVCLDVGSSTGGFTHFLLLNGASRVYALDVDIKQLDWKIRNDPRVQTIELNARFLEPSHIGELVDIVTMDASFISLTMLLPRIPEVLKPGGVCVALVKPQFEVGREHVGKGGIVRDPGLQQSAIDKVSEAGRRAGLEFVKSEESPITGREGNREFFALFKRVSGCERKPDRAQPSSK